MIAMIIRVVRADFSDLFNGLIRSIAKRALTKDSHASTYYETKKDGGSDEVFEDYDVNVFGALGLSYLCFAS